ncbi:hypothetical protein Ahy_B09g096080 isoform F [Arachis hypogaea]|uniref:Uncharacterized protein n=1 Tax=Arachis hypogaea TaxID=3818 RepID=A0A444XI49_ARAHY|nr:hypothetical protein Ahy_B09g096080 isoform F [Arachis hypogaea]
MSLIYLAYPLIESL